MFSGLGPDTRYVVKDIFLSWGRICTVKYPAHYLTTAGDGLDGLSVDFLSEVCYFSRTTPPKGVPTRGGTRR